MSGNKLMNIDVSITVLKMIQDRLEDENLLNKFLHFYDEYGCVNPQEIRDNIIYDTNLIYAPKVIQILKEFSEFEHVDNKLLKSIWHLIVLDIIDKMDEWIDEE